MLWETCLFTLVYDTSISSKVIKRCIHDWCRYTAAIQKLLVVHRDRFRYRHYSWTLFSGYNTPVCIVRLGITLWTTLSLLNRKTTEWIVSAYSYHKPCYWTLIPRLCARTALIPSDAVHIDLPRALTTSCCNNVPINNNKRKIKKSALYNSGMI